MPEYLILRDLIQSGPFTLEEMKRDGIKSTDLIWVQGISTAWHFSEEIRELKDLLQIQALRTNDGSQTVVNVQSKNLDNSSMSTEEYRENYRYMPKTAEKRLAQTQPLEEDTSIAKKQQPGTPNPLSHPYIIKVIIVDDHTLFREGVKMALSQKKDIKIIGEAENGMQLMQLLKHSQPDIILLDILMPVMDGITALASIRSRYSDIKVIMLTMYNDHSMVSKLMATGANAYLTKSADSENIYEAIKTCYAKSYYFNELTNMSMLEKLRTVEKIRAIHASQENPVPPKMESVRPVEAEPVTQKMPGSPIPRKINKRMVWIVSSILLILCGIVAGIIMLRDPDSGAGRALLPLTSQDSGSLKPKTPTVQSAIVKSLTLDSIERTVRSRDSISAASKVSPRDIADSISGENTAAIKTDTGSLLNKKTGTTKAPGHEKEKSLITPTQPRLTKTDPDNDFENTGSEKKMVSRANEKKAYTIKNLNHLVTAFTNKYQVETGGGLSGIVLTIYNQTVYKIDQVTVELKYLQVNSTIYKTETLVIQDINPLSSQQIQAPDSDKGVKIEYRIIAIRSSELDL